MPLPPLRKNSSPTTAPMTDSPAAMRNPVKIAGSAAGSCSLRSRGPAATRPCSVNRSCWLASAESRPNSVLDTIGKIEMITHTRTREPMPNAEDVADQRHDGEDRDRLGGDRGRARSSARPTSPGPSGRRASCRATIEMASPTSADAAPSSTSAVSMSPRTSASRNDWSTTVAGDGSRKLGLSKTCSHAPRVHQPPQADEDDEADAAGRRCRSSGGRRGARRRRRRRVDGRLVGDRRVGASPCVGASTRHACAPRRAWLTSPAQLGERRRRSAGRASGGRRTARRTTATMRPGRADITSTRVDRNTAS